MGDGVAIQLKNIKKVYDLPTEKRTTIMEYVSSPFKRSKINTFEVLMDIDLEIKKGEFIGILGNNGCGKSTLLKIIAGIYRPTSGKVTVKGRMVPFLELGVGFSPELTGRENIYLNGIILGMPRKFLKQKFDEIVAFAELEKFVDLPLKNYSSGMQVRLAFSIAMMSDADIYLLDEVLAVGDQHFQQKCLDVFRNHKKQGKTIVLVTHDPDLVREFCDRAALISDGRIVVEGAPEKVLVQLNK